MSETKLMTILISFIGLLMSSNLQPLEKSTHHKTTLPPINSTPGYDTTTTDTTATTATTETGNSTAETPTTTSTEPWPTTTTSVAPATTETPGLACCDVLSLNPPTSPVLLPSDVATFSASCSCTSSNGTYCPVIFVAEEAQGLISYVESYTEQTETRCEIKAEVQALTSKFNRRSFEVPVKIVGAEKSISLSFRFEKSGHGERCFRDFDCWYSNDQICDDMGFCSCYSDIPSFVKEEEKCFSASAYGESCSFDEQCISSDNHTICNYETGRCQCKMGYSPLSDSDPVCVSDTPTTTEASTTSTTAGPKTSTTDVWTTSTTDGSTTETPSSSVLPAVVCCDKFEWSTPQSLLLPSDVANISASCTCKTNNQTYCPMIAIGDEAKDQISFVETFSDLARNHCAIVVTIQALENKFNRRSLEVPVKCLEPAKSHNVVLRFEKSGSGEKCNQDPDCWYNKDQICEGGRCSCYSDIPIFLKEEEKCVSASAYGEMCMYDEQCNSKDDHTICDDKAKRCQCKKDYHPKSDSNPVCVTGSSDMLIPSQAVIIGSAIISMLFISLRM